MIILVKKRKEILGNFVENIRNLNVLKNKNDLLCKFAFLVFFMLFLLRTVGMDRDFPSFGIGFYQPKDEGQYSQMAINLYHYSDFSSYDGLEFTTAESLRSNIVANLLQVLSLRIIGNNYYGLRFPYLLFSLSCFFFVYKILRLCAQRYNYEKKECMILTFVLLFLMLTDFSILLMSRIAETTSMRVLVTTVFIFLWFLTESRRKTKYFLSGFFSVFSIFLVYFSNVHLLMLLVALFLLKVVKAIKNRNSKEIKRDLIEFMAFSIIGGVSALCISELYYFSVWKSGAINNFITCIFRFSDRLATTSNTGFNIKTSIFGIMSLLSSNMFFYSFFLGTLAVFSFVINLYRFITSKDENYFVVIFIQLAILIQSMITDDYMERKAIIIYPVIILSIFMAFDNSFLKRLSRGLIRLAIIISIISIPAYLISMNWLREAKGYIKDFDELDIRAWFTFTILQILWMCILATLLIIKKQNSLKVICPLLVGICIFMVANNMYFSTKYVYTYDSFTEKEAMISIGEIAKDEYVSAPWVYGYTLYGTIKPVWNRDTYYREEIENGSIKYFCDYSSGPYYANLMNLDNKIELVASYSRKCKAMGLEYPIGLYRRTE